MSLIDTVRRHLPEKYRELAKFLVVGGSSYVVDVGLFTLLSHTVLANKVITAKAISILIATIFSYVLNREWSFSKRGGRETHHEAMLFFVVNALALGLNLVPLAISQYVLGINPQNYSSITVSIANFIAANVIGTIVGMAFRFWAYRRWVFPEELEPHRDESLAEQALAEAEIIAGEPDAPAHLGRHEAADHPGRHEAPGPDTEHPAASSTGRNGSPVAPPNGSARPNGSAHPNVSARSNGSAHPDPHQSPATSGNGSTTPLPHARP